MSSVDSETSIINHGVVAYFDILGYQSILNNNQVKETAQLVVNVLLKIPEEVKTSIFEPIPKTIDDSILRERVNKHQWAVFSDTILVACPIELNDSSLNQLLDWSAFLLVSHKIQERMFENGCPVRGAIAYGDFYIENRCFAGKPIVEAYRLAQQLDLAACAFCKDARQAFEDLIKDRKTESDFLQYFVFPYLVPLNNNSEKRLLTSTWGYSILSKVVHGDVTIRDSVLWAFLAHKKDISLGVRSKIDNTEIYLSHIITNFKMPTNIIEHEKHEGG